MTRPGLILHPDTPFPIGVEYYRAPAPRPEYWDGDFARLSAAGFHIVRSASYWNWMEPRPGQYELDDIDLLFDLAEKHNLYLWLDVMLGTHGAGPEWLTREHPDIVVVNREGQRIVHDAHPAYPQGACIHCYDHPAWREYGGALLRHVVDRYKDRPNMLIWGLWDGVNLSSAWTGMGPQLPLLLREHAGQVQVVAAGQVHPGRAQRPAVAPLQALGGRGAAPLQQRGGRDAAVQALPLRKPRRASQVDGQRDGGHRPRPRGALSRRMVA